MLCPFDKDPERAVKEKQMLEFLKKMLGAGNDAKLRKLDKTLAAVLALEEEYRRLTDEQLQAKTAEFRRRLQEGETEDDLLPEAFATVREAADRVLGMRPYRVQVLGGIVLHQGRIAEMKTGEGKTLVSTMPAYLNALRGEGVHIVTVNDYLARRDSEWMGKVHRFLGLSVGLIVHDLEPEERRRPTPAISPTERTTNSALTTCGTTWSSARGTWCSAGMPLLSWTRWTPS